MEFSQYFFASAYIMMRVYPMATPPGIKSEI